MKIQGLTLFTDKLKEQHHFYSNVLGLSILKFNEDELEVQIGFTKLTLKKSATDHKYHYCFLIPCNLLKEAINWISTRTSLIQLEDGSVIQHFENWNAHSTYFYDGAGNLAEFIVRYDLQNEDKAPFDSSKILCVNEIGMPTGNIEMINNSLETQLNSMFWKGDKERFGTNGTQTGLFLLVNNQEKKNWFPTTIHTQSAPFYAAIEVDQKKHFIEFESEKLTVLSEVQHLSGT